MRTIVLLLGLCCGCQLLAYAAEHNDSTPGCADEPRWGDSACYGDGSYADADRPRQPDLHPPADCGRPGCTPLPVGCSCPAGP